MKKLIITAVFCLCVINAHAYTPVRPCYNCDRPIPHTTYGRFNNDRSEQQAMKALATAAIGLAVIAILIELQPSRIDGQVKLAQF